MTRWVRRVLPVTTYGKPENVFLPVGSRIVGWERLDNPSLSILLTVIVPARPTDGGELPQATRTLVYVFTEGRGAGEGMEVEATPGQWRLLRPFNAKPGGGLLFEIHSPEPLPPGGPRATSYVCANGVHKAPEQPVVATTDVKHQRRLEHLEEVQAAHSNAIDDLESFEDATANRLTKLDVELKRVEQLYSILERSVHKRFVGMGKRLTGWKSSRKALELQAKSKAPAKKRVRKG